MDWVGSRADAAESLLNDFSVRPAQPSAEFSPLVSGLLSNGSTPVASGEWPMPHVPRNARNDFRYEFSLSAGPEFDTDSADAGGGEGKDIEAADFDKGTATSEDTSVGVDASMESRKEPSMEHDDASVLKSPGVSSRGGEGGMLKMGMSGLVAVPKLEGGAAMAGGDSEVPDVGSGSDSAPKSLGVQQGDRAIQKKKSGASPKKPGPNLPVTPGAQMTISGLTSGVQNGTPSHTKMCRDRLNNMFERLRHTLPPAPSGVEVKHKAQVLDYAIAVLKGMVDRTSQLEVELAVSSNKATMDWISKLVNRVDSFPAAAKEVMTLFSRRRSWKHAELWTADRRAIPEGAEPEESTILAFCTSVSNESTGMKTASLDQFSKESESFVFRAKEGVQGRVWSSMRPEWVTGLADPKNFRRASLARKYGLKVCLAVPVTITGKIEAVLCFYDVKHRPYDTQCLELAMRLAWALGNAVGGKRAKVSAFTPSGTSNT